MIKTKTLLLSLFIFSTLWGNAQQAYIDSLLSVYESDANDTARISAINEIIYIYSRTNGELALEYGEQALQLAKTSSYKIGLAEVFGSIGIVYQARGFYDTSLVYFDSAITIAHHEQDTFALASINNNIGLSHMRSGELDSSIVYLSLASDYKAFLGDDLEVSRAFTMGNIAAVYYKMNEKTKALKAYKEVAIIFKKHQQQLYLAQCYGEIGQVNLDLTRYKKAEVYLNKVDSILMLNDSKYLQSISLLRRGELKLETENYTEAIQKLEKALAMFEEMQVYANIAAAKNKLALAHLNLDQANNALDYAKSANEIAIQVNDEHLEMESYEILINVYAMKGFYRKAYENHKKYYELTMTVRDKEREKRLDQLTTKYESLKKETKIKELTKANEIAQLESEKSKTQNRYIITVAIALVLLLATFILFLIGRLQLRKKMQAVTLKLHEQELSELEKTQKLLSAKFMIEGQEKERERLARDLHDDLGSQLAAIKLHTENLGTEQNPELDKTKQQINNAYEDVRRISHNLMPMSLSKAGLPSAIKDLSQNISSTKKLQIEVQSIGFERRLDSTTEIMLFRIVQEALKNIIHHADAQNVVIQLINDGNLLSLTIEDDGKGFDMDNIENSEGLGMKSMKSRVEFLNGKMDIRSEKREGTSIYVEVGNLE